MEKQKTVKDLNVIISDRLPIIGDTVINVNKKSVNYGLMSSVNTRWIDIDNWKVYIRQK